MKINDIFRFFRRSFFAAAFCMFFLPTFAVRAADADASLAIIVGVSDYAYDGHPPLPYAKNDARRLSEVLKKSGFKVIELSVGGSRGEPTRANVEKTLNRYLSDSYKAKTKLVYFSCHGFDPGESKTLLAVQDSRPQNLDSYVSAGRVRRLLQNDESATNKILIVDSCHAGGTRGKTASDEADRFVKGLKSYDVDGVLTFYSCELNQNSGALVGDKADEKSISLFTFWLVEGLRGFADADGDNAIGTDELLEYVRTNIEKMRKFPGVVKSLQEAGLHKTTATQHFTLAASQSDSLDETLNGFANHLATLGEGLRIKTLDVREFEIEPIDWRSVDEENDAKSLALRCAPTLEAKIDAKKPRFQTRVAENVENVENIENAENEENAPNDEDWTGTFKGGTLDPSSETPREDAQVKSRSGDDKQATLKSVVRRDVDPDGRNVYLVTSELFVDENATFRLSAAVPVDQTGETVAATPNETLSQPSNRNLPTFEFHVKGPNDRQFRPRRARTIRGAEWLALNPGETYKIVFKQDGKNAYAVRVLIDGRNTLPQETAKNDAKATQKYVFAEPEDENQRRENDQFIDETPEIAASDPLPTGLDSAKYWVFRNAQTFEVRGFYKPKDQIENGENYNAFQVRSSAESLDDDYADQMGLVTIAIYELVTPDQPEKWIVYRSRGGGPNDVATVPGPSASHPTRTVDDVALGEMLRCFRVRYASSAALQEYAAER